MFQTIAEPIVVVGIYNQGKFMPKKFRWREKIYLISEITLATDLKDGGVRKRRYSVLSGGNLYRLEFNRDTEHWFITEVWYE